METPLLVPSFSSLAAGNVNDVFALLQEVITEAFLISLCDIYYSYVAVPTTHFAEVCILDSGGFEALAAADPELGIPAFSGGREWTEEKYHEAVSRWPSDFPAILIGYDHPNLRVSLPEQITRAEVARSRYPGFLYEFLLKPETTSQTRLPIEKLLHVIKNLGQFSVIGIAEKELGDSLLDRLANLAKIRTKLDEAGISSPVHLLGNLDPLTTILYFLVGAEIFDGLSWMKYAFLNGLAIYRPIGGVMNFGIQERSRLVLARTYADNIYYVSRMKLEMQKFLVDKRFENFRHHSSLAADVLVAIQTKLRRL